MDYSFVRKLVKNISVVDAEKIYSILTSNGIEVFGKKEDIYHNMTIEMISENVDVYVSAADLEQARALIMSIGLEKHLCSDIEAKANAEKSEVEKAEEEFYRKHKQNQIFAWVVIVGVIIFMMLQFFK